MKKIIAVAGTFIILGAMLPLLLIFAIAGSSSSGLSTTSGAAVNLGPVTNLGVVKPPTVIFAIDNQAAAASSCHLSPAYLLAQQYYESGYNPMALSPAGAVGLSQFESATFASYAQPIPPGGANPPSRKNPIDSAYAEARMLCADGVTTNPMGAFITYNCGSTSLVCQIASSSYATGIIGLAKKLTGAQE